MLKDVVICKFRLYPLKGVKVLLLLLENIFHTEGLKITEEDMAADILLVGSQDLGVPVGIHNQVGLDTADTGFLEAGKKDNQGSVLVAAGFHKPGVVADSNNFAEGKELQKDLGHKEPDGDYKGAGIGSVHAAGIVARTREVALVVGSHQKEVPEAAGFAEPELAHLRVVDVAQLRLVEEGLAGMSAVGGELEDLCFLAEEQVMEEVVLGSEKKV